MAAEFLLTFLAVLVQLGLPARPNQLRGKEPESGYASYRSEMHFHLAIYLNSTFLSRIFFGEQNCFHIDFSDA